MKVRLDVAVDAQATFASDGYVLALDREIAFNHRTGLDVWGHRGALLLRLQFGWNDLYLHLSDNVGLGSTSGPEVVFTDGA